MLLMLYSINISNPNPPLPIYVCLVYLLHTPPSASLRDRGGGGGGSHIIVPLKKLNIVCHWNVWKGSRANKWNGLFTVYNAKIEFGIAVNEDIAKQKPIHFSMPWQLWILITRKAKRKLTDLKDKNFNTPSNLND